MSEFKFFDKGCEKTTLLIPGWATDYRIFGTLELGTNYLTPVKFSTPDLDKDILAAMKNHNIDKVSIFGWSIGAFAAVRFMARYKECVDDATLVSVRKRYDPERLKYIRVLLKRNKTSFLNKFYQDCFYKNEKSEYAWFKDNLLNEYIDKISVEDLLGGLDYLSANEISAKDLKGHRLRFVHGAEDVVAPVQEVSELKEELPDAKLVIIYRSGHMPFLNPGFKEICSGEHVAYR